MEGPVEDVHATQGGSFEEFLDAQLHDLRARLVLEHHRRSTQPTAAGAGPEDALRACAQQAQQAWPPEAADLPLLPNQPEERAPRASVGEAPAAQEAGCGDPKAGAKAAGRREGLLAHASWQIEDDEVRGRIKQFQDGKGGTAGWRKCLANDPEHGTSGEAIVHLPEQGLASARARWWPPRVIHPNGAFRITWDMIGAVSILCDAIFIPLQFFISTSESEGLKVVTLIMIVFWFTDIPLNFVTGFHRAGTLVMNLKQIARRYITSWFFFDVTLITFDVVLLLVENGESPTGMLRTLRTFRVLKSLRMARMVRLPPFLNRLQDNVRSEHVNAFGGIGQMLVFIIMTNHMIACAWYGLATLDIDSADGWVAINMPPDASTGYLYLTSLHWSLTQFTPASMEITPKNVSERVFNIIAIIMGMVLFSSFVSRITNTMNYLRALDFENTKQFVLLQSYFRKHGLSTSLCVRIRGHLDAYLAEKRKDIKETDIKLLSHMSASLRIELHYETFMPKVRHHPFLREYDTNFAHSMQRICHLAAGQSSLYGGDVLFNRDDVCSKMYFLHGGLLMYDLTNRRAGGFSKSRSQIEVKPTEVTEGEWLAEAALWAQTWAHPGQATAHGLCTCVTISVGQFHAAVRENRVATVASAIYAGIFVGWLNTVSISQLTDRQMLSFDVARAVHVAFEEPEEGETMA